MQGREYQSHKTFPNTKKKDHCKINPVDAMVFDVQRKMTFPKQLTFRDRKGRNLQ